MIVEVDRIGGEHVLGERLSFAPLTEQAQNRDKATS